MSKIRHSFTTVCLVLSLLVMTAAPLGALVASNSELISGKPQQLPVDGMVTMVDIGAKSCIPCKMMAPILTELALEYEGKAAIAFIDVWQHPDEAKKYGIRTIPTQIFYDKQGKEYMRHTGFMKKESIEKILNKLNAG